MEKTKLLIRFEKALNELHNQELTRFVGVGDIPKLVYEDNTDVADCVVKMMYQEIVDFTERIYGFDYNLNQYFGLSQVISVEYVDDPITELEAISITIKFDDDEMECLILSDEIQIVGSSDCYSKQDVLDCEDCSGLYCDVLTIAKLMYQG